VQGGFFLKKKPLNLPVSVKSRIENAVIATYVEGDRFQPVPFVQDQKIN
jgi:hypothetical protein